MLTCFVHFWNTLHLNVSFKVAFVFILELKQSGKILPCRIGNSGKRASARCPVFGYSKFSTLSRDGETVGPFRVGPKCGAKLRPKNLDQFAAPCQSYVPRLHNVCHATKNIAWCLDCIRSVTCQHASKIHCIVSSNKVCVFLFTRKHTNFVTHEFTYARYAC